MWEKVTSNRCSQNQQCCKSECWPGLSRVAGEEASLWAGSGKGCLGSRLTAGIWRASKKGVLFVTVFQVRVNGAGEGAGVQRACVRSKWRRRQGVSGYLRKNTERRKKAEWEGESTCIIQKKSATYVKENFKCIYRKKGGRKKERQNEEGEEGGAQVD